MRVKATTNQIKKELANAFNVKSNDFSVKQDHSSIDVKVKVLVSISEVNRIMDKYSHTYTCEVTGEVLGGGNTFVFVNYDDEKIKLTSDIETQVDAIIDGLNICEKMPRRLVLEMIANKLNQEELFGSALTTDDLMELLSTISYARLPSISKFLNQFRI